MDANYKLINSVDPTKCRPKIRDKFCKLTLSSNKKKQEDPEKKELIRESIANSNVSRNLLSQLLTDDESDDGKQLQQQQEPKEPVVNFLMRTDSSPSIKSGKRKESLNTTHCSEAERNMEKSVEMEALVVSALDNTEFRPNVDEDIEKLSSRVSMLTVDGAPVTISSEGRSSCEAHIALTSARNQNVGQAQRFSDLLRGQYKTDPNVSICISSSSDDTPITITDSSEGEDEFAAHVSSMQAANLPPSLDTTKADRMAMFLRDVRRNYGLPADTPDREREQRRREIADADTEPMTSESQSQTHDAPKATSSDNTETTSAGGPMLGTLRNIETVKRIAVADTELMSVGGELSPSPTKRRAAADTESMPPEENFELSPKNLSRGRIASADTVDMTMASDTSHGSPHYAPVMNVGTDVLNDSGQHSSASVPEDSLTIAETSEEEHGNDESKEHEAEKSEEDSPRATEESLGTTEQPRTSSELTRTHSSSFKSTESSLSSRQNSQFQINISAKINIKIQVSQQMDESMSPNSTAPSTAQSETESADEMPQSSAQKAANQTPIFEEIKLQSPPERDVSQPESPEIEESPPERDLPRPESPEVARPPEELDMERAQRLLNEIYGNSWKTPEVMRSLKKSNASARRVRNLPPPPPPPEEFREETKDESALDDFSIFRRNIPQDLDSTRLPCTPVNSFKTTKPTFKTPKPVGTTSKTSHRPQVFEEEESTPRTAPLEVTKTKSGREVRQMRRAIIDSESSESDDSSDSDKSAKAFRAPKPVSTASRSNHHPQAVEEEKSTLPQLEVTKTKSSRKVRPKRTAIVDSESSESDDSSDSDKSLKPVETPKPGGTAARSTRRPQVMEEEKSTLPQLEVTKTKSGREVRPRWRAIVNSDSDESEGADASADSDKSWIKDEKEEQENKPPPRAKQNKRKTNLTRKKNNDNELIYLDLSKGEVEVQDDVSLSPPANHDEKFNLRLEEILRTCKYEDKPKMECTPGKSKRKLFSAIINDNDENLTAPFDSPKERLQNLDDECVSISGAPMPPRFEPFNKHLEAVKTGRPIFKIPTPGTAKRDCGHTPGRALNQMEPPSTPIRKERTAVGEISRTPSDKYGFLKSLDVSVPKSLCHPDALYYRDNYRQKRDELAKKLYEIYNAKCFNSELDVPLKWNKKLTNTAGRCMNKKRLGDRISAIELSEKVLTSADRLRCTLIHEFCHAATWIFNGEGGHGASWKAWARKANQIFPELPKIGVCHQYDIEYKYTYKCTLCAAKSHAHSKSKKVENIRCSYCHGAIEVYLNKKDKDGNTIATPVKEPTGFAKFVKDKYKEYKRPDLKHADVMKLLSNEFASMKVGTKT